jgi:hypothetical protein
MAALQAAGKGVMAMKVLGEGQLRDKLEDALRYAVNKAPIDAFTVGIESRDDLKGIMDLIPKVSQPA